MVILRTVTLLKVFIKNINLNLKEIKKIQSDKPGVHFRSTRHHLEVELAPVQLLIEDSLEYFNPEPGIKVLTIFIIFKDFAAFITPLLDNNSLTSI